MNEELDLKILKAIINDKVNALTFSYRYDHSLFDEDSERFAKLVLDYIKNFRTPPTRRTLIDRHKDNDHLVKIIDKTWEEIDDLEYDIREYAYDLSEIKKRFQLKAVEKIRDIASEEDPDSPEDPDVYFNKLSLEISRVTSLDLEKTHTQKPVGDYLEEFSNAYESRKLNPEAVPEIKCWYSMIDAVGGGFSPGDLIMVGGNTNSGKACGINTPILTTNGWSTMGDIKVGYYVYNENGEPVKVISTSEIMYDHECYELEFSDGEKIIADANHQWNTLNFSERRATVKNTDEYRAIRRAKRPSRAIKNTKPWLTLCNKNRKYIVKDKPEPQLRTTKDISKTVRVTSLKEKPYNHTISPSKPISFAPQDIDLDPYVLGAWLGDGDSYNGSITSCDQQIIDEISKHYNCNKWSSKYRWGISKICTLLKKLNLICNKHIPKEYLFNSIDNRLALLQGLMDTDGTVRQSGACEFTTTKESLKDDFLELTRGLGLIPRVNKGIAKYKDKNGVVKITGDKFNISFRTEIPVFRLRRKLHKQKRESFKFQYRTIVSCNKVNSVPVRCIQVESKSHMFLCGKSLIPTHNSQLLNNMGKQIWLQENIIDTQLSDLSKGYNVLYFSLEMPYQKCFERFLASLANVPQRSLAKALLNPQEEERVEKAKRFIKMYQDSGYYFDIVDVPRNLTIEEIELRYHDALLRYRPDVVIVDYMGLMHSNALAKEQDWLKVGGISASLHEFARAYDVVMITAAQLTDLNRSSHGSAEESRRVGVHRWGRSSLIMHNVTFAIQIETRQNEKTFPDLKIHIVKNRNGELDDGSLIKNFVNASLIDVPYELSNLSSDISANIPDLIKSIRDAKNKSEAA